MKIQPCTAEEENHCYVWWLKREKYVDIIQNSSWVLRRNWKKWEFIPRVRYIPGVPILPCSAFTLFSSLAQPAAHSQVIPVEDDVVLAECLSFCLLYVCCLLTGGGEEKKGCRRAGYKNQRTLKILQDNFLYVRSVVSQWSALHIPEEGRE